MAAGRDREADGQAHPPCADQPCPSRPFFGAAAFAQDQPAFVGHHALRAALEARGEFYHERLVEVLGADRAGSVVYPTVAVEGDAEIDLGGRVVRLNAHATAHTDCDLSMLDAETGMPSFPPTCCSSTASRRWTAACLAGSAARKAEGVWCQAQGCRPMGRRSWN